MSLPSLEIAVLFLVFNRLETTKQVFQAIRQAQPPRLYVASDGPRATHDDEEKKVQSVRDYILENIDWDCELRTLFREQNLGCKSAVSGAISWFFENEEKGIILEDDCLPNLTFFRFCEELLERYHYDTRIMAISGDNFQLGRKRTKYSYYFSRFPHCWGWATWSRAWEFYDIEMKLWSEIKRDRWLKDILKNRAEERYNIQKFQKVYDNEIDTWDYQWEFCCWIQNGLTILPNVNMVSNIGFGKEGTHIKTERSYLSNMPNYSVDFPLSHPPFIIQDVRADRFTHNVMNSMRSRISRKIRNFLEI